MIFAEQSRRKVGDRFEAYSERFESVELTVTELLRFADFDACFEALGAALLPEGAATPAEALAVYRQWNSEEAVRSAGGVVAVGVTVAAVTPVESDHEEKDGQF